MKRLFAVVLMVVLGLQTVEPAFAARRVVARRTHRHRTTVVVHRGWPLRRPARVVYVHPPRVAVRVQPGVFLAPLIFTGIIIAGASVPSHDMMVWEDSETLVKEDDWTEFTLDADSRGTQLWLEVRGGKVQFDWAEVVFENGDTRVVDFRTKTYGTGIYSLLDFRDGRKVDHVRVVARSRSPETKVILRMEK